MKLECEKEHQEQLLLSVIPAYIAAEVKYYYYSQFGLEAADLSELSQQS